uniref:Capsid protein n=1 Tax=Leptomonas pyrrhocoris tombus-like virus TaxID=3070845 RepID=A0AA50Q9D9_9TOMB|nr:hypothetical protein [Leptomonas pyrrhocoris tombus-like virus]
MISDISVISNLINLSRSKTYPTNRTRSERGFLAKVDDLHKTLRAFDSNFGVNKKTSHNYVVNSRSANRTLHSAASGVPTWAPNGNRFVEPDFPLDMSKSEYNQLYAVFGEPDWPIPLPISSHEVASTSYASVAGSFSGSMVLTAAVDTTAFIMFDPNGITPACVYQLDSGRLVNTDFSTQLNYQNYNHCYRTDTVVGINSRPPIAVHFTQVDPRIMAAGKFTEFTKSDKSIQENYLADSIKSNVMHQQFMGGHARVSISMPWQGSATVKVGDNYTAPTLFGNKLMHALGGKDNFTRNTIVLYPFDSVEDKRTSDKGSLMYNSYNAAASDVFNTMNRTYSLVGAGGTSTLNLDLRLIPGLNEWTHMPVTFDWGSGNVTRTNPSPHSGFPMIAIQLAKDQAVSINIEGWCAYNCETIPGEGSGDILVQDGPCTNSHPNSVGNIPMTVGVEYGSNPDTAGRTLSANYVGVRMPYESMVVRTSPPSAARADQKSAASIVLRKFVSNFAPLAARFMSGIGGFAGNMIPQMVPFLANKIAQYLPVTTKPSPLLLKW